MMFYSETEAGMEDRSPVLSQDHGIEQILIVTDEYDDDQDGQIEKLLSSCIQSYEPFGFEGAPITELHSS